MTFSDVSVLHVEDDVFLALETARNLEVMGMRSVCVAHDLRTAERLFVQEPFDLALLDVNLGNAESTVALGVALARQGAHVVFTSGYAKSELGAKVQPFDFVQKPAAFAEVEACLRYALVRRTSPVRAAE